MSQEIYVTRSSMPKIEEFTKAIQPLWNSGILTNMGTYHNKLERKLKKCLGVDHLSLFCNGHMSLEIAIQALGLTGEVITTPFTFISTTHAIVRNNLTPVFCDIDPISYVMDASKIESLITEKTSAIIPVHVYGNVCDVEAIKRIAEKYNLKVIYDAAHAFGVKQKGIPIASFGDASILSFHATKVFNTIEGGAIAYNNSSFSEILKKLRNFGICNAEVIDEIGTNAKMNEFQAIMGLCNLKHIESEIRKRKIVAERYKRNLQGIVGIQLNQVQIGVESNYAYFPVVFNEKEFGATRDEIHKELEYNKIYSRKYFSLTLNQECYQHKFDQYDVPVAKSISSQVLALPIYADLDVNDIDRICDIIVKLPKFKNSKYAS